MPLWEFIFLNLFFIGLLFIAVYGEDILEKLKRDL